MGFGGADGGAVGGADGGAGAGQAVIKGNAANTKTKQMLLASTNNLLFFIDKNSFI